MCLRLPTMARSSSAIFPAGAAQNPDDAAKLTTSFTLPGGVASARTVQLDVKATFAADSDTVIIQIQRNGNTVNETLGYDDFVTDNAPFCCWRTPHQPSSARLRLKWPACWPVLHCHRHLCKLRSCCLTIALMEFYGHYLLRRGAGPLGPTTSSGPLSPDQGYLALSSPQGVAFPPAFIKQFVR